MIKALVAFAVLGATASGAAAQSAPAAKPPRIKVAVIPGIAVNIDAARVDALGQDLADAIATELDVDAIGGLEVRRALPPDGIPPDCVATPACFNDVAQRVGANQLLFVVMVDTGSGGAIQVDSTWVEPVSARSASRPAIDIATISDAKSRFTSAAPTLLPDAPRRPKSLPGGGGPATSMSPEVAPHVTLPAMITAGVSVVGLGVGIGFGLSTRAKFNACDGAPDRCGDDERDSIRTRGILADAGYLLAIGGAVATAVIFATSGKESQLVISPITEGGATAMWSGNF